MQLMHAFVRSELHFFACDPYDHSGAPSARRFRRDAPRTRTGSRALGIKPHLLCRH
jgi:hypothetical protein